MLNANQLVLAFLVCKICAWTPQGTVLDVPQDVDLEERIKADPNNCNVYYYLKTPLTCGEGNAFNKATLRCDSSENVAKSDPSCGEGGSGEEMGAGGFGASGGDGFDVVSGSVNGEGRPGFKEGYEREGTDADFPQSQYGGSGIGGNEEFQTGAKEEFSHSQYQVEEVLGINGYPSQGRNEKFESFPPEYVGNFQKRDAEDDSFPTYSSASGNEEGEEGKGHESGSDSDQLGSYSSGASSENKSSSVSENEDSNGSSAIGGQVGYDDGKEVGQDEDQAGYKDETDRGEENYSESDDSDDISGYGEDSEGNGENDKSASTESAGYEGEDDDELGGYRSGGGTGGGGTDGGGTGDGGTGESLDGYVKETYKNAGRRGRKSKNTNADRKSKKIGNSRSTKQAEDGDGLQSNDWENRRLKQGWAAFRGLVGRHRE